VCVPRGAVCPVCRTPSPRAQEELKTQVTSLKTKEEYAIKDHKLCDEKMSGIEKSEVTIQENLSRLQTEIQELETALRGCDKRIAVVGKRISKAETTIFAAFSREVGVSNIREYEEKQLKDVEERKEKRRKNREMRSKLDAQLQFEQQRDFKAPLQKVQKRAAQNKTKMAKAESQIESIQQQDSEVRSELQEASKALAQAQVSVCTRARAARAAHCIVS
jgi:structural maintenance of chromosome 1